MSNIYPNILTRGYQSSLDKTNIEDGKIRFTMDTSQLFIDIDSERKEITDFIKGKTEQEIRSIIAPLPKFYFSSDTHKFLYNNGNEWIVVGETNQVVDWSDIENKPTTFNPSSHNHDDIYYTETEINTKLNAKQDADTAITTSNIGDQSVKFATNATKAESADSATKATKDANGNIINTTYAPLASPILTGTPTVPTAAAGTKTEQIANTSFVDTAINNAITGISKFDTVVVSSFSDLPDTGVKGTIYFVPSTTTGTNNIYDEYVWVSTSNKYEKIGSANIDLSNYVNDISITGTGNAITGVTKSGNTITYTTDTTF